MAYGVPMDISTSYAERSNLSIRTSCRRFTRLTNGFSKRLTNHLAAIDLYVAHYNLCRVHESLKTTPAMTLGITDHVGRLVNRLMRLSPLNRSCRRVKHRQIGGGDFR